MQIVQTTICLLLFVYSNLLQVTNTIVLNMILLIVKANESVYACDNENYSTDVNVLIVKILKYMHFSLHLAQNVCMYCAQLYMCSDITANM